ncbi:hypothetical protein UFOVP384_51 [uncultured Caudovirales phage]|uniref:Uncharacterized protein n=1 Tax=uncultured Caudovirales phage TaxID=2100421 RepID=A0A6J7X2S8_9CAUD|nr:hypothetical protein UFOVP384_51 [uncultured Caudovirales phage]
MPTDNQFYANLGQDRSVISSQIKFSNIEEVLVVFANRIALQAEKNLRSNKLGKDTNASGTLSESIRVTPVSFMGGDYSIEIAMADYWEWVENGRRPGKRPPINSIIKWIKDKQLRLDDKGTTAKGYKRSGTLISKSKKKVMVGDKKVSILEAVAYKIAAKIGKYGTKATNFLSDAVDDYKDDLVKEMAKALKRDVVTIINTSTKIEAK